MPLLRRPDREWPHPSFSQLPNQERLPGGAIITNEMCGRSVHDGRWSYIAWAGGAEALFDLQSDPYQMIDLASNTEHDANLATMKKLLKDPAAVHQSTRQK